MLGWMPGIWLLWFGIALVLGWESTASGIARTIVALAWMISLVVTGNRAANFRCPRCGKHFFKTFWYYNSFARRCVHCGLRKWSTTDFR